ncbi:hypothetical protein Deia_00289 [Candidatus Deianiraea vastatrix]|uniref:Uncharacterized protein n=2 Tax=Candidatus Deianiraea vastatrix TaxID=2163644 RepID=A0A5B8XDK2_9RICK|nr:hypothetical protein Deia_00289 [Candidatus Deianiraea vastatrix]
MSQAFNAKIQQAFKGNRDKAMSAFTLLQLITVTLAAINAVEGLGVNAQKAGELELSDGFGSEFGGNSFLGDIKHHRELNENPDNTVKQTEQDPNQDKCQSVERDKMSDDEWRDFVLCKNDISFHDGDLGKESISEGLQEGDIHRERGFSLCNTIPHGVILAQPVVDEKADLHVFCVEGKNFTEDCGYGNCKWFSALEQRYNEYFHLNRDYVNALGINKFDDVTSFGLSQLQPKAWHLTENLTEENQYLFSHAYHKTGADLNNICTLFDKYKKETMSKDIQNLENLNEYQKLQDELEKLDKNKDADRINEINGRLMRLRVNAQKAWESQECSINIEDSVKGLGYIPMLDYYMRNKVINPINRSGYIIQNMDGVPMVYLDSDGRIFNFAQDVEKDYIDVAEFCSQLISTLRCQLGYAGLKNNNSKERELFIKYNKEASKPRGFYASHDTLVSSNSDEKFEIFVHEFFHSLGFSHSFLNRDPNYDIDRDHTKSVLCDKDGKSFLNMSIMSYQFNPLDLMRSIQDKHNENLKKFINSVENLQDRANLDSALKSLKFYQDIQKDTNSYIPLLDTFEAQTYHMPIGDIKNGYFKTKDVNGNEVYVTTVRKIAEIFMKHGHSIFVDDVLFKEIKSEINK